MRGGGLLLAVWLALAGAAAAQQPGRPGTFDYWLLALTWSPTWCLDNGGAQCRTGNRLGLVVHGLWPQYESGWPEYCAAPGKLPAGVVDAMLPLMPSRALVEHEWTRHGTCSGLDAPRYFEATRAAHARIAVPEPLRRPDGTRTFTLPELERLFAEANPGLDGTMVAVLCRGRFLSEIRVCLDKEMNYRPCARDVRDRCRANIEVPVPK